MSIPATYEICYCSLKESTRIKKELTEFYQEINLLDTHIHYLGYHRYSQEDVEKISTKHLELKIILDGIKEKISSLSMKCFRAGSNHYSSELAKEKCECLEKTWQLRNDSFERLSKTFRMFTTPPQGQVCPSPSSLPSFFAFMPHASAFPLLAPPVRGIPVPTLYPTEKLLQPLMGPPPLLGPFYPPYFQTP